ncbi:MAG: hypothetical protein ICCCNLDF_02862 [Planctomycetes bacterium]|nr:hypothetical protein [Planctomycetota bacterium]
MRLIQSALFATAMLLALAPAVIADRVRPVPVKDDSKEAFSEFERLLPLVKSGEEADAKAVREALGDKSPWVVIAAVEAVRQGEVDKPGAGKVFLPEILGLMSEDSAKLHKDEIVTVNLLACLGALAKRDEEDALKVVQALIDWQRWSKNQVVRLRHMAERVLFNLSGEDCTLTEDTISFWEWWVRNKGMAQAEKAPEKKSKTAPIVFKEPIVGTRLVFVIDISDSMKHPINADDLEKIKKLTSHLDWKSMPDRPNPLDLAKAELKYSIDKLRPDAAANAKDKKKGTRGVKGDPEARTFAIITYSKDVAMFTDGWIEATDKNCDLWIKNVDDLALESTTNIHGALLKAFKFNGSKKESDSPELDRECILNGAHTIVFLTDGYPTWSDDSDSTSEKDEFGNPVGNGQYVKRDKLLELAAHLNRFRKVMINTVGIGIHDAKLMKGFAKESGGAYTDWGCKIDWK